MRARRERKEAGSWIKFRLLMWKNFVQQWRHPLQTAAELILPVLTMSLVLVLRSQIDPSVMDTRTYPPIPAHTLHYSMGVMSGMNLTRISMAFSPENDILRDVVASATTKLLLKNARDQLLPIIDILPIEIPPDLLNSTQVYEVIKRFVNDSIVTGYASSAKLRGIYAEEEATRRVIAAVEFDDSLHEITEIPLDLSYALRFPERPRLNSFFVTGGRTWRTAHVFPMFEVPGPRFPFSWEGGNDPGYVNEMFIAVQHMISTELVSKVAGKNLDFDVHIQRYPHPPYVLDLAKEALQFLFPSFIMISFSYTAINIIRSVTVEKELQLKETMKIMGLPTWLHWMAWFFKQFIYLLFASVLILVILKVNWFTTEGGFSDYAVFTNTPWTVLFFFLTLYLTCTIFFCFMISGFFSKASTAALFGGVIWFLTYIPAFLLAMDVNMSAAMQAVTCLSINSAMSYGFQLLLARESTGGLQWGEFMMSPEADSSRFEFGHVVIMMSFNCVLYMLVALYLEHVLPGPYGTPKPWYFIFQTQFWCSRRSNTYDIGVDSGDTASITKETDPTDLPIGVKIQNLKKVYGNNIAVNNLSLNIYDDQITVLLGHNGAGKSTTISMLTGNVDITSGSVTVAGYDIAEQTSSARSHIGLCPQHNVLFNELTVKEHLEFFSRLKGFSGIELEEEIITLIEKLELQDKRDYQSAGLSGGQKRRLGVGVALCGAAKVVLLDEPTSGMDPASRRALWDLLQREKKGRSMILTTHFMDEADILGDRVAIMADGRLQCVGSPYFLKRHYGVGYTLVVVKNEGFRLEDCTALINRYIPGTIVKEDRGTEVTYSVTNEYSHVFESMLSDLEANINEIHFKNYGLLATTLEDVFMSVGSDVVATTDLDDSAANTTVSSNADTLAFEFESSLEKLDGTGNGRETGIRLICQHVVAIWMKLFLVLTRSWPLLLLQVLVPLVQIIATLGVLQYILSLTESIHRRELSIAEGFTSTETLVSFNGSSISSPGSLAKSAYESLFLSANNPTMEVTVVDNRPIDEYYLERTEDLSDMAILRHRLLIGATFGDNSATAWFSNFGYHDVANSLAAVHSALLRAINPAANLTVYNHPLEANYVNQDDMQMMVAFLSMQVASGIGNSLSIVSAVFIMFYIKERVSRAKLLQKAAGIRPVVMWGSAAVFDWCWFCVIAVGIVISCAAFSVIGLSTVHELGRMYLCVIVYGATMLPIVYVFSYFFNGPAVGFVTMFFVNILFGMMGAQIVEALLSPQLETEHVANILDAIFQFFPLYSLITSVRLLNQVGLLKWSCLQSCEYLSAMQPNLTECSIEAMCQSPHLPDECCVRDDPWFDWDYPGVLRYLVCMLISGVVMWSVLLVAEYRLFQKVFNRERKALPVDESTLDSDVVEETRHVERVGAGVGLGQHSLVANGLTKYYGKHLAVNQVSFTVGETECFGLLGVNGAGKTTTFKMLMGDETISSGDAFVSGQSVKTNITQVYENIGYCPQFEATFGELTGRETLWLFSALRGLPARGATIHGEALAHALGFYKHLDKRVDYYSGGNKRKLSTAVALLGRTRLIFVDEPTTGVDPAAKRQMWNAVREARRSGRGVVLTSHSMEECEALCSRLTIMVNGQFQCLGTPQHLKNKFSEGFTLTIKIKVDEETKTVRTEGSDVVKDYVSSNFRYPKIMEEYQGLLTYYLPDKSMAWSRMFGILEAAKRDLPVEDYSISQTTLEQIFLQFTKYQQEAQQT